MIDTPKTLDDPDLNVRLAAVFCVTLETWDNADLAALNNSLHGFGKVAEGCRAYKAALTAGLLQKNGHPTAKEELLRAVSHVICKRLDAGTFQ